MHILLWCLVDTIHIHLTCIYLLRHVVYIHTLGLSTILSIINQSSEITQYWVIWVIGLFVMDVWMCKIITLIWNVLLWFSDYVFYNSVGRSVETSVVHSQSKRWDGIGAPYERSRPGENTACNIYLALLNQDLLMSL